MRALRHRDFFLLWLGALLSFSGTWIQSTAQHWLVFELTHDEAKLGLVAFCSSAPVAILGPIAGVMADRYNKRTVLVITTAIFGLGALFVGMATRSGAIQYAHILAVASIVGIAGSVEMPTRQSTVSRVVPLEDLAAAVPMQAMTFNLARIVGPAVGGILLGLFGASVCYFVNSASYVFLIVAVLLIRSDLSPSKESGQPIRDLILEGMRFTFRDQRLRTLFIMEAIVSAFGLAYLALMAAIAKEMLHLNKQGLGMAFSSVGVGAIVSLLFLSSRISGKTRGLMIRVAMTVFGIGLVLLSLTRSPLLAYPLFGLLGMCSIMQFNSTNALFQLIAPERLRGRVISMHIWALSGLGPFGTLFLSWLAGRTSSPVALQVGGVAVLLGAAWSWNQRAAFQDLP